MRRGELGLGGGPEGAQRAAAAAEPCGHARREAEREDGRDGPQGQQHARAADPGDILPPRHPQQTRRATRPIVRRDHLLMGGKGASGVGPF